MLRQVLLMVGAGILSALVVVQVGHQQPPSSPSPETAYDRVMRTNVLRCGYIVYPPETIKDANTGQLSGTVVDLTHQAAKLLGWQVEWVAEVGFADMFEGLNNGRYDALCSGLWENPSRAKSALFTIPVNFGVYYGFVRNDDKRFDADIQQVNRGDVKIAVIDGEYGEIVAKESFPTAGTLRLPQLSDVSQLLLSVSTGKADIAFLQKGPAKGFMEHNPGTLKVLDNTPIRIMPAPMLAVAPGEYRLKNVLDATFRFLLNTGEVEKVLKTYDPHLDSYLLLAKPYTTP